MDILDALTKKEDMRLNGNFYEKIPNRYGSTAFKPDFKVDTKINPAPFKYDLMDERFISYLTKNNVQNNGDTLAIKTRTFYDWQPKKHVTTQDGRLWQIQSVRYETKNKNTLSFQKYAPDTTFILMLVGKDNPWGLQ